MLNSHIDILHTLVQEKQPNICQIAAYKDQVCIYSDCWNGYQKTDCTHIMSATKSIIALLIGIAIDQGKIKSIDDKILDYFPEYKVKRGEKTIYDITIRHLITMRAPYKCKGDPWTKVLAWRTKYRGQKRIIIITQMRVNLFHLQYLFQIQKKI